MQKTELTLSGDHALNAASVIVADVEALLIDAAAPLNPQVLTTTLMRLANALLQRQRAGMKSERLHARLKGTFLPDDHACRADTQGFFPDHRKKPFIHPALKGRTLR